MTTCAEYASLLAQAEADLARAQVERDAAELDVDAAEVAMNLAFQELTDKNTIFSQKQQAVQTANSQIMYITMMMQSQGC